MLPWVGRPAPRMNNQEMIEARIKQQRAGEVVGDHYAQQGAHVAMQVIKQLLETVEAEALIGTHKDIGEGAFFANLIGNLLKHTDKLTDETRRKIDEAITINRALGIQERSAKKAIEN